MAGSPLLSLHEPELDFRGVDGSPLPLSLEELELDFFGVRGSLSLLSFDELELYFLGERCDLVEWEFPIFLLGDNDLERWLFDMDADRDRRVTGSSSIA